MREIEQATGSIEYEDTGGNGPVVVLLYGFLMDASLWDGEISDHSVDHRCLAPTLPLGAHRHPMRAEADLSLREIARLAAEFLDRLDLGNVTLVGNDTGGALLQLLICQDAARMIASCLPPAKRLTTTPRPDGKSAGAHREALSGDVRSVHAANAAEAAPPPADRVWMADHAR